MNHDLLMSIQQISRQKDISADILIKAVELALLSAAKKHYGSLRAVSVKIDKETGELKVFTSKRVVEIMRNYTTEIPVEEAVKLGPAVQLDQMLEVEVTPRDFGRIAAQTARQILVQKIKEAEREIIYEEYKDKEGELVSGVVQRFEKNDIIIDLEKTEAILPYNQQVRRETYKRGERIKALIIEVKSGSKSQPILVSRIHPGLLARLFEMEVPEIYDGLVRIMAIAREPGDRSKVAVAATDTNLDPVGTCVGMKGSRVQTIVRELNGEKIEIVQWSPDPAVFIQSALSPAKISKVLLNSEAETAEVIVPDDQLSLAIGKKGQNARLAARLTGWKIDIKNESEAGSQLKGQLTKELFKPDEKDDEKSLEPPTENPTENEEKVLELEISEPSDENQ